MDAETISNSEAKQLPPVPIKTYQWEEVRRARKKGGYPWTYIDKDPFDENTEMENKYLLEPKNTDTLMDGSNSSVDVSISHYLDKDDIQTIVEPPSKSTEQLAEIPKQSERETRAKSEEPGRKRKHSIESSYSRVSKYSLSKLGFLKRLRETKIKLPKFSFSKSDSTLNKKRKPENKLKETFEKPKQIEGPLYIHIPLKPPPGETDEFSHLEFEEHKRPSPIKEESKEETKEEKVATPIDPTSPVQLIILTAPSDDEILDDTPIPDTPSETDTKFFDNKRIEELKCIARDVVNKYSPETKRKSIAKNNSVIIEEIEDEAVGKEITDIEEVNPTMTEKKITDESNIQSEVEIIEVVETSINESLDNTDDVETTQVKKHLKEGKKNKKVKKDKDSKNIEEQILSSQKTDDDKLKENRKIDGLIIECESPKEKQMEEKPENMLENQIQDEMKEENIVQTEKSNKVKEALTQKEQQVEVVMKSENIIRNNEEIKISVDEEDGLKTETITVEVEAQDVIKEDVNEVKRLSPILKKRVSFKRKSKEENDAIYEDVQVDSNKLATPIQSMSVDEEKTYLDGKIMKDTSFEEDYNKWSKLHDHEYEPINPPGEVQDQQPKKASTPVTDSDIEFLAAKAADIEMRTTGIITVKDQQSKGADAIFVPLSSVLKEVEVEEKKEPAADGHGKKIQDAIKHQATNLRRQASIFGEKASSQAEKIQTRVRSIKRPKIDKPKFKKPNLPKLKINKPNMPKFHKPKMPEFQKPHMPQFKKPNLPHIKKPNISMPSFTLPKRKEPTNRQYSTESNFGDSTKKNLFDFSTYPRIFKKKKEQDEDVQTPRNGTDVTPDSERTTLPRFSRWKGKFSKAKMDEAPVASGTSVVSKESERTTDTRDSYRIPLHSEESMDRESLDLRSKVEHEEDQSSHREDSLERRMTLDKIEAENRYRYEMEIENDYIKENQEIQRSSSLNEKLNERWCHGTFQPQVTDLDAPQEFPAQESSSSGDLPRRGVLEEINSDEFFLRQKGISEDNMEVVAYLSSEIREAFRTPNNALNQLEDLRSSNQSLPLNTEASKKRPMKKPKRKKTPHVSQEAIQYDQESINTEPEEYPKEYYPEEPERPKRRNKKRQDVDLDGIDDRIILHLKREISDENILYENEHMKGIEQPGIVVSDPYQEAFFHVNPSAPPRKHKSLKSLNDSINEENIEKEIEKYHMEHEYQIPTPDEPPKRPFRTRSRTRSQSRSIQQDEDLSSKRTDSLENECIPCNEEPCSRVLCDYMGYSVIDKSKIRDPPLPPCAPRRKRSIKSNVSGQEEKCFTIPRRFHETEQPIRPFRNYSTLGPNRPPRKKSVPNLTDEEKENVPGSQYIEIEDDYHSKKLQSGDIIQKMRDRPLPAPPRPPRRGRDSIRTPLRDITPEKMLQETEVSVQTEPLPDDFECEEFVHEENDKVITPSVDKKPIREFEHQETVTHGALIVQPFSNEIEETPMQTFSKSTERIITIRREVDEDSEIPEEFKLLQSPTIVERIIERHVPSQLEPNQEVELLKTQKLQVTDLDVDRLAVNELHASKIKVGEIDSSSINVAEINSNSGNLVVSGIELPASFFKELVEKLQEQKEKDEAEKVEQKKTPIEDHQVPPQKPPRVNENNSVTEKMEHIYEPIDEIPCKDKDAQKIDKLQEVLETKEVKDEETNEYIAEDTKVSAEEKVNIIYEEINQPEEIPPPRPPQPTIDTNYIPSQPPPSFYALRSPPTGFKDLDIDDDIPMAPRRRRHHKAAVQSLSSSDEAPLSRRRHRTPEPSISQLTGQLTRACVTAADRQIKRLLQHLTQMVMGQTIPGLDGKHNVNVAVVILLVLIASLILLGWGGNGRNIHHHHWEYFNPPKDI